MCSSSTCLNISAEDEIVSDDVMMGLVMGASAVLFKEDACQGLVLFPIGGLVVVVKDTFLLASLAALLVCGSLFGNFLGG